MQSTSAGINGSGHNFVRTAQIDSESHGLGSTLEEISDTRKNIPPPRIAARFYRLTTDNPSSSPSSSYYNSVSYVQLNQSNNIHREVPNSFAAQHQRRISLIEKKKAKFAVRAAHAEQVRLRAAFFKAAPRSTKNSEKKAIAAQHAREKFLADIAAACAEEVKKAKGVAESVKEKREAEGNKLRKNIEERHAEAKKRRENELRKCSGVKRSHTHSYCCKSRFRSVKYQDTLSIDVAVSRIQKQWRIYQRLKVIKEFRAVGLTIGSVKQESFDHLANLVGHVDVLMTMVRILRICGMKEIEIQSTSEMANVRIFLSAYLILGHPKQTLNTKDGAENLGEVISFNKDDSKDTQAEDIVAKAGDLLNFFENLVMQLSPMNNYMATQAQQSKMLEKYVDFYNAFIAWKARDSDTLINLMFLQFIELEKIWLSVKESNEEVVAESYKKGIRDNQIMLMARMKRLAGEKRYKQLMSQAMREARASQSPQSDKQSTKNIQFCPKISTEPKERSANSIATSANVMAAVLDPLTAPIQHEDTSVSNIDIIKFAQPIMQQNRVITHEIAINKDFRLSEDVISIRRTAMKSAFDIMRNDIKAGNHDDWILATAYNVRKKLQRLLTEGKSMHASIGEWLDHDLIANQLRHQSFSYDKFFHEISLLLPKLCAPFRDKEIEKIIEEDFRHNDVVSRIEALIYALDILQLDYANFLLQQKIPLILANAAKYETHQFVQQLAETNGYLQMTENAWKTAYDKVIVEASRRDPDKKEIYFNKSIAEKTYAQMLVDVFTITGEEAKIPETLILDKNRIIRIRSEVLRIVTCGAILLQCKNVLKRDVRSLWMVEGARIYMVLENTKSQEQAVQGIQTALESSRSMPSAIKDYIHELIDRTIKASNLQIPELGDPVLRLLMTRVRGYILTRLGTRTEKEKSKNSFITGESLVTLGIPEYSQKVCEITHEIGRVAIVDREAHGRWYEQIIRKLNTKQNNDNNKMDVDAYSFNFV
ncbi:putative iq calmodulin-binding motif domain protein [Erysiphe neolycopersici]|uniref:Putative iq calmodulin-binding motif domain protein n=1 Tax=Erysiphe neolycopersici TaxID=212602 RepID=A0A420I064_9PEZI|nr:putative iq calmodulin-binding motif domain protein [Erysiphe neolycopersici]